VELFYSYSLPEDLLLRQQPQIIDGTEPFKKENWTFGNSKTNILISLPNYADY